MTEIEESESMKSCILFKIMYDIVLIFLQKRYRYSRSESCGICGNVFLTVISIEIQKNIYQFRLNDNLYLSKSKSSYLQIAVTRRGRNSGDACIINFMKVNLYPFLTISPMPSSRRQVAKKQALLGLPIHGQNSSTFI